MLHHRGTPVVVALCLTTLAACHKKDDAPAPARSAAPAPPPAPKPAPARAAPAFDVPFRGSYQRTAKVTYKNNQRVRLVNAAGTASLTIEPGKVTYAQAYPEGARTSHVTETYTFAQSDLHPVADGYDVPLVYRSIEQDSRGYSPDSKEPKLEARRQGSGWEIGFLYRDLNGVNGGIEFR